MNIEHLSACHHCPVMKLANDQATCVSGKNIVDQSDLSCPLDFWDNPPSPEWPLLRLAPILAHPNFNLPEEWTKSPVIQELYRQKMQHAARSIPSYPDKFSGRGVVICGLGKYFPSAYISIRMTRHIGDDSPIELWGLPGETVEPWMREAVKDLDVTFRCPGDEQCITPFRAAHVPGWQLKSYAVLNSRFQQVRFSDADSYPIASLAGIWESEQFLARGAVFWPDPISGFNLAGATWKVLGLPPELVTEWCFESGQFVVDKQRCWRELWLADWMNQNSEFYYRFDSGHLFGDKDTFNVAWRFLGSAYCLIPFRPHYISLGYIQRDFAGEPLFIHRINSKLILDPADRINRTITFRSTQRRVRDDRIPLERVVWGFVEELRMMAPAVQAQAAPFMMPIMAAEAVEPEHHAIPLAGDVVESIAKLVGADVLARKWEELSGRPCGCADRKKYLNDKSEEIIGWAREFFNWSG